MIDDGSQQAGDGLDIPDDFQDSLPAGGYTDLPFEMPDASSDVAYGSLPDQEYDPDQDWREAQVAHMDKTYGEFAPQTEQHQEATDG
jgi:hypothetical protein